MSRYNGIRTVTNGLVFCVDAANPQSIVSGQTTWKDLTFNTTGGTLVNGVGFSGSGITSALSFDGTDDYGTFPTNTLPSGNSEISYNTWVKWYGNGTNSNDFIIGYGLDTAANQVPIIIISPTNKFLFEFGSSSGVITTLFDVKTGDTLNVVGTYNKTFNSLYVNGSLVGRRTYSSANIIPNGSNGYNGGLGTLFSSFGNVGSGALRRYGTFNGDISVAQIYNRGLSPFDVYQNFNALKGRYGIPDIVTGGLVLNLDAGNPYSYNPDNTGSTVWTDVSYNTTGGTLVNGTFYTGGTMQFDGVDDYVNCENKQSTRPTVFTQVSWIYNTDSNSRQQGIFCSYSELLVAGFFTQVVGSPHKVRYVVGSNTGSGAGFYKDVTGGITINLNTWYQVVVTYDGSIMKSYVNGVQDINESWSTGIGYDDVNNRVIVGGTYTKTSGVVAPFKGNISNTTLYNRVLSISEIQQNFNALRGRFGI